MRTGEISRRIWQEVGRTKKGEAVYRSVAGNLAVEKDHDFLCEPTKRELEEIIYD